MDQDTQLRAINQRHAEAVRRRNKPARLGAFISNYITRRIEPTQQRLALISSIWQDLVPPDLRRHCALAGLVRGEMKIVVDAPAYLYRLHLIGNDLLKQLQTRCRRSGVKNINFTIGAVSDLSARQTR